MRSTGFFGAHEKSRTIEKKKSRGFCIVVDLSLKVIDFTMFTQPNLITKAELSLRNGQDKPQVWVAYKGKVYDVTASRLWKNGKHYEHWAGQDLTDELVDAPHTDEVFKKFVVIGYLIL
jgi:predicted heme/steroid binding protein